MNCLLCHRTINQKLKFHDLFLLNSNQETVCNSCMDQFEKIGDAHCSRCHRPTSEKICADCLRWEKMDYIVNHHALFAYNEVMQDFFKSYKFLGDYRLKSVFSSCLKILDKSYTLVPIPLSNERLEERGFNQTSALLDDINLTYKDLLEKTDTIKQSSLTRAERLASKNTFSIKENVSLPHKIILIDDIYTTGTTLYHAVQLLKSHGVEDIKTFSLCR